MPGFIHKKGKVGVVFALRHAHYEAVFQTTGSAWDNPPASASAATRSKGWISSTA